MVEFVDTQSYLYAKNKQMCEFWIRGTGHGDLESPRHSLPPNTTCLYHLQVCILNIFRKFIIAIEMFMCIKFWYFHRERNQFIGHTINSIRLAEPELFFRNCHDLKFGYQF